ncbi:hypothetical protein QEG73_21770 [Chitinophagaceae bacterium 26-R-25]|nr:hypothetical protein [Chitinophagaceae bacterium 26-R-25]
MIIKLNHLEDHEIAEQFRALIQMVQTMRQAQIEWHEHFGYALKKRKDEWEKKVDACISSFVDSKPNPIAEEKSQNVVEEDPDFYAGGFDY